MIPSENSEATGDQEPEIQRTEPGAACLRTIASTDLLQGEPEVLIQHGEDTYRLKLTRNGKLILQK